MVFLSLFSYIVLCDFFPMGTNANSVNNSGLPISITEIVLAVWIGMFTLDKFVSKLNHFPYEDFNILDSLAIIFYFISLILRLIPNDNCYLAARLDSIFQIKKLLFIYDCTNSKGLFYRWILFYGIWNSYIPTQCFNGSGLKFTWSPKWYTWTVWIQITPSKLIDVFFFSIPSCTSWATSWWSYSYSCLRSASQRKLWCTTIKLWTAVCCRMFFFQLFLSLGENTLLRN